MLLLPFPCHRNDFFHLGEVRLPAEDAAYLVAGSDELRRVACTACADFCRDLLARRLLCGGDHFLDREALSVAEVEDVALAALPQVFECKHMRVGEVDDVDVVAQTGTIGRLVVIAVDRVSHRVRRGRGCHLRKTSPARESHRDDPSAGCQR